MLVSVLVFLPLKVKRGSSINHLSLQYFDSHQLTKSVAVPFGQHDFIHVHTYVNPKSRLAKREDTHFYDEAVCRGERALDKIMNQAPSTRVFTRQDQIDAWAPMERRGVVSPDLQPVLLDLDIPYSQDIVRGVATFQSKDIITPDGQTYVSAHYSLFLKDFIRSIIPRFHSTVCVKTTH